MVAEVNTTIDLGWKFAIFGIFASIFAAGLIKSISASMVTKVNPNPYIPNIFKILLTYASGFVFWTMFDGPWYGKIAQCFMCGSVAVVSYEAALASFLQIIPTIFDVLKTKFTTQLQKQDK